MIEIIYHSNCPDGIIARNLLQTYFFIRNIEHTTVPYAYEHNFGHLENAIWVDCSPETWEEFEYGLNHNCQYYDHHESRKEFFLKANNPCAVYGENKKLQSGAMLVYENFNKYDVDYGIKRIATLAAIGDTWASDNYDFELARGMGAFISSIGNAYKWENDYDREQLLKYAEIFKVKTQEEARKLASGAIIVNDVYKIAFINSMHISNASEILRNEKQVDIIVGWEFFTENQKYYTCAVSLRSNDKFDCQEFAKYNGGGGHKRAAGLRFRMTNLEINPIHEFCEMLKSYLNPPS
jgi:nanoRNase/pAp phosphatase (c-di-AMP/oligoRNAs hydrolase)